MNITLTPEEVKALYAYIYGGDVTPEEYQLGMEIHDRIFRTVEKETEARIAETIELTCTDPATSEEVVIKGMPSEEES